MNDEITIDGKKYALVKKEEPKNNKRQLFMSASNVMGFYIDNNLDYEEEFKAIGLDLTFKKVGEEEVLNTNIGSNNYELPNGTKISKQYVDYAQKIFNALYGKKKKVTHEFSVYAMKNDKEETPKDSPVALVKERAVCIIAPRVSEDIIEPVEEK